MADKHSGTKIFFGLVLLGVLKLVYMIIKQVIKVLARVIVYFGLYIPFFYFLCGVVMVLTGGFSFEIISLNSILYYTGLSLCVVCSVLITIQTYAQKPLSGITAGCAEAIHAARDKIPSHKPVKERPPLYVYHSQDHPELLIEEYEDRFVVYIDDGVSPLRPLRTELKQDR